MAPRISQKTIDNKIKYVNNTVEKIKRGTASIPEIDKACDIVSWLWKWKVIDRDECGKLADMLSDAMEGK
jgi:hypothetical protein